MATIDPDDLPKNAVQKAVRAMQEAEEAIFKGNADQYHSDTLHDAAGGLDEVEETLRDCLLYLESCDWKLGPGRVETPWNVGLRALIQKLRDMKV